MFIVLLKFSDNKQQASQYMDGHNQWIQQGFDDAVFLVVGSLIPQIGGGIIAHNITRDALEDRVNKDPFVAQDIVKAEILEFSPARTDERLSFLLND